jgi:hypothetical protein
MSAVQYEVTATVRRDLCAAFEKFMIEIHVPDVMATNAFSDARFSKISPGKYRASYSAVSREILDEYLQADSPRLREHMAYHFPDGVEFSREECDILASF